MAIENIRSGLAGLRATKQKQATMEQQFAFAEDMINIATDTAVGLEAAKESSETAWDEYEAGYAELGGDVSNIKRPSKFKQTLQTLIPGGSEGFFDKPGGKGQVRIGNKLFSADQVRSLGEFKQVLSTPEGMQIKAAFGDKDPMAELKKTIDSDFVKGKFENIDYSVYADDDKSVEEYDLEESERRRIRDAELARTAGILNKTQETISDQWIGKLGGTSYNVMDDFSQKAKLSLDTIARENMYRTLGQSGLARRAEVIEYNQWLRDKAYSKKNVISGNLPTIDYAKDYDDFLGKFGTLDVSTLGDTKPMDYLRKIQPSDDRSIEEVLGYDWDIEDPPDRPEFIVPSEEETFDEPLEDISDYEFPEFEEWDDPPPAWGGKRFESQFVDPMGNLRSGSEFGNRIEDFDWNKFNK